MRFNYNYEKVTGGYRWNLLKRCLWEIGIEPTCVSDIGAQTVLEFDRELSEDEKSKLDILMQDDPQHPNKHAANTFTIVDLWEDFEHFKNECGLADLRLYYGESEEGSGNINRIFIQHPTPLTQEQIEIVRNAYKNLLK